MLKREHESPLSQISAYDQQQQACGA